MRLHLLLSAVNCQIISVTFFLALVSPMAFAQAPQSTVAPQPAETTMNSMISAIRANSLPDFIASGDREFQAGMTREMLSSINQSLASRLTEGYTSTFLTKMDQQGFGVYVWKMVFKDGNDDVLVFMAVKDGKVGGFWLR